MSQQPTVIILAGGLSTRFRASAGKLDKLNAQICGKRVIDHVIDAVRATKLPFYVVKRKHIEHLTNPGMGDSIAHGVAATPNSAGWLILPADLPLIQPSTLIAVANALLEHPIVMPEYRGQRGHPVGFQAFLGTHLKELHGDQGAKSIVKKYATHHLDVSDEGATLDVDTVEQLAHAEFLIWARLDNSKHMPK